MKKNILFLANIYSGWKGGLYYVKNMLYALLMYTETTKNMNIYVLVNDEAESVFREFEEAYQNVTLIKEDTSLFTQIKKKMRKIYWTNLQKKPICWSLSDGIMEKYEIDAVFPVQTLDYYYRKKCVCWIPDFQQNHFPEFFSNQELQERKKVNGEIARLHEKLILSSQSAMDDYMNAYPDCKEGVYIVPFVSAIEHPSDEEKYFNEVLKKYSIPNKYFIVANQFWRHKNHRVLFEAVSILKEKFGSDIVLVCTGQIENDRNPEYASELVEFIERKHLQDCIKILGLIDRKEQVLLIDKSVALIQPSLFEGWGTCVEDAKTLGTRIVMSDIPVHYEQKTDDCIIFERNNSEQLAEIMRKLWECQEFTGESDYNMKIAASEYGKRFYDVIIK